MNDTSSKSPRQLFIEFLTLNLLSKRTIQAYVYWIADLARFHNRAPAPLVDDDIRAWLLHLIEQRKHSAYFVSLAINSIRAFFGRHLGCYTHRVAISNDRIEHVDESGVTFRYKDYRTGGTTRTMTLVGEEFVRRLSLHVWPEGITKIRHYGLLGNNRRAKAVSLAREALRESQWDHRPLVSPRIVARITDQGLTCPHCQQAELLCVGRLDRPNSNRGFVQPSKKVGRPPDHNNPTPATPDLFRSSVRPHCEIAHKPVPPTFRSQSTACRPLRASHTSPDARQSKLRHRDQVEWCKTNR